MSWTWGVWYLQISSPRRSQSFTRGSRQILAWNCVPAMLPSCQIWFEVTVSLKAIFSYSMKQFFRKFSSHSSSCWDSYWVTNVWWHLRNRWFSRRAVRWRYLCLEIFLSSSNLCCRLNKGCHPSPDPQFFWTLFKKPLTPRPPLRFEHHVANFFDGFLKKRVNVCRDKIRQNNA